MSKLLLTNILRSPGYHFGRGLNEVIYLYLHQDHYLNCHSAFMKVFMGKQFAPRELLAAPWITIESGIIKNSSNCSHNNLYCVSICYKYVLNFHHHPEQI